MENHAIFIQLEIFEIFVMLGKGAHLAHPGFDTVNGKQFTMPIISCLFPLDCCRRFSGNIVYNAVDTAHFIDNPVGDLTQQSMG